MAVYKILKWSLGLMELRFSRLEQPSKLRPVDFWAGLDFLLPSRIQYIYTI